MYHPAQGRTPAPRAFARLFKGETDQLIGIHYFNSQGQPVFTQARPGSTCLQQPSAMCQQSQGRCLQPCHGMHSPDAV